MKKYFFAISFLALIVFSPSKVVSQYFGRNKVNYETPDFKMIKTKHFDIYYYEEEKEAAKYAAEMAERWYNRHSKLTGDTLKGRQPLILYSSFPMFSVTNVLGGSTIGIGTGGVTEPVLRRIVMPFAGPLKETDHVLGHELVHAFQFDIATKADSSARTGLNNINRLPLWFIEGMAEYFSIGPVDPFTAMWMRDAVQDTIPTIDDLTNPKFFPYRYGQALLSYIGGKYGDDKLVDILKVAVRKGDLRLAIDTVLSTKIDTLSKQWHQAIRDNYAALKQLTDSASVYGPQLIGAKKYGEDLNISPVISPDGKYILFFSSRDLFSIDLFLADAQTGEIKKTVLKTVLNTHLENLEFINSAGAWDPSGEKFVFSSVVDSRPVLSILNVNTGEIEKEIRFKELGEIFSPSWSPDGKQIVFSALSNGFTDLFIYNLDDGTTKRITNDAYADLQPAWSPDGNTIVFSTDRFSTNLSSLDFGNYKLALYDLKTEKISELNTFEKGKNINPQWSADSKHIFFISDADGISNIYRYDLNTNTISKITSLFTGVSGITSLSPAISTAMKTNKLVYSVYEKGKYKIYSMDPEKMFSQVAATENYNPEFVETLPPVKRKSNLLVNNLNDFSLAKDDTSSFTYTDYDASLHLVGFAQPSAGVGIDRFGTYVGGGIALYWSDILGNHNLATAFQLQIGGGFSNVGGLLSYVNTAHRINWGVAVQQIPYFNTGYIAGFDTLNGSLVYKEQDFTFKQTNRTINGIIMYPFSETLRMELGAGFTNVSFSNTVRTIIISSYGNIIKDDTQDLPTDTDINLWQADAALVYDNSIFGATAPIIGSRWRAEITPSVGTLSFNSALLDYRQYFMPVRPFTLAFRVLHAGRYGVDAENYRLLPYYLGYPGLVRGYDYNSFSNAEYNADLLSPDPLINRLQGSKILVANIELRFPLLGLFGIGEGFYGYFPIDFGGFYDAGLAWDKGMKLALSGNGRKPVRSVGFTIRVNLFGYAIGEIDYVKPLDRVDKSWVWQFNLTEGF
ncbi:hypothetical protein ABRY23_07525 [Melioribacteraceae bacterium 4301-Me]|uniref:hypothetical protein n=1 Tax=Pyranulibacter aquaticus TaxID=3163344 RepID=UPI003598B0AC